MTTPKLQMPELVVGQAGKELTHNQALAVMDQLAQATVISRVIATPPGSPANGDMYIVAAAATGAWSGQSGKLAYWLTTVAAWTFITPANGWSVWVTDESKRYELVSGVWTVFAGGGGIAPGQNLLYNSLGNINQRGYVSGTATVIANQYTIDRYRVVVSGQNLSFAASGNGFIKTAPAGGVEQVIEGINISGGNHAISWTGTAAASVNGTARTNGEVFSLPANTNAVVRFTGGTFQNEKVELGSAVTPVFNRPFISELDLCKRYFTSSFHIGEKPSHGAFSSWLAGFCWAATGIGSPFIPYPVEMRSAPTVVFYRPSSLATPDGSWAWYNGTAYVQGAPAVADSVAMRNGISVNMTVSGSTQGSSYIVRGNYTSDAEL